MVANPPPIHLLSFVFQAAADSFDRHSWTCKAKHRKCDCARPTCQAFTDQGIPCDGYEVRLRWGSGIASRGRYAGAEAPVDTSIPLRVPGRRRDRIRARRAQQEGEIRTQVTEVTSSQDYAQEGMRLLDNFLSRYAHSSR